MTETSHNIQDVIIHCPECKRQHIDFVSGDWYYIPHKTHKCLFCGHCWKPFNYCTRGVKSPPIKLNEEK